jgi:sulfatase modifying factor 1
VLMFPMLAASLVLSTSPNPVPAAGHFSVVPLACSSNEDDVDGRSAKRLPVLPSKTGVSSAKGSTRGRSIPLGAMKAFEGTDDDAEAIPAHGSPTRSSRYVCPSDMVMIGRSYCIDTYEASLVQQKDDQPWPFYDLVSDQVPVRAVSLPGVYPQGYISGLQARSACEASGKRLCKPDEWKNACMGPKKTIFPYGNAREVGRCNDNGRSSMHFFNADLDDKPENSWKWGFNGNMIDPRLNQLEGTLTRSGERTGCTNEYGVYDMVGNLHEWVDDPDGTFQGGYYLDTHLNGDGCYYRTTAHPISHLDYSTGFRCCADVDDL